MKLQQRNAKKCIEMHAHQYSPFIAKALSLCFWRRSSARSSADQDDVNIQRLLVELLPPPPLEATVLFRHFEDLRAPVLIFVVLTAMAIQNRPNASSSEFSRGLLHSCRMAPVSKGLSSVRVPSRLTGVS